MSCARKSGEAVFAEPGFNAVATKGCNWGSWNSTVYHCRAANKETGINLTAPKDSSSTVWIYVIGPDNFEDGQKQTMGVAGDSLEAIS